MTARVGPPRHRDIGPSEILLQRLWLVPPARPGWGARLPPQGSRDQRRLSASLAGRRPDLPLPRCARASRMPDPSPTRASSISGTDEHRPSLLPPPVRRRNNHGSRACPPVFRQVVRPAFRATPCLAPGAPPARFPAAVRAPNRRGTISRPLFGRETTPGSIGCRLVFRKTAPGRSAAPRCSAAGGTAFFPRRGLAAKTDSGSLPMAVPPPDKVRQQ